MPSQAAPSNPTAAAPQAIILAAGKGTRMGGDLPKVLFEVAGQPMVRWVVQACREAGVERCIVVVGYEGDQVRQALAHEPNIEFVEQREQRGTAHAAQMAQPLFEHQPACDVFVLAGDGPLIRGATLEKLLQVHRQAGAAATLATAIIDDPTGYGRVIRDESGAFSAIVEHKDASDSQRAVREINPSYYCFRSDALWETLDEVRSDNRQNEYYITDVPSLLKARGRTVMVVDAVPSEDVLSINTPQQLEQVDRVLRARLEAAGQEVTH